MIIDYSALFMDCMINFTFTVNRHHNFWYSAENCEKIMHKIKS